MLGLVNHFKRIYPNVGFFKPVGTDFSNGVPRNVQLMHSVFSLPGSTDAMTATDERTAFQVRPREIRVCSATSAELARIGYMRANMMLCSIA